MTPVQFLVDRQPETTGRSLFVKKRVPSPLLVPVVSIEDPFDQDDWEAWSRLTARVGIQVVGDDLTVTNPKRIEKAAEERACNCLLLKVNQIGSVTEAIQAYVSFVSRHVFLTKWPLGVYIYILRITSILPGRKGNNGNLKKSFMWNYQSSLSGAGANWPL